ncbi:hypothetical protein MAR_033719, partial [Mya arenaria]
GPSYRIRVKTAYYRNLFSGHQNVSIKIYGSKGTIDWTQLKQTLNRGEITEEWLNTENIGQVIKKIVLSTGGGELWRPDYVTIHVKNTNNLYVFRFSMWDFFHRGSTDVYPEGHCSRPFINRPLAQELRGQVIQDIKARVETECQIQCLEHPKCKTIVYNKRSEYCTAYDYGQTRQRVDGIVFELLPCYGRNG